MGLGICREWRGRFRRFVEPREEDRTCLMAYLHIGTKHQNRRSAHPMKSLMSCWASCLQRSAFRQHFSAGLSSRALLRFCNNPHFQPRKQKARREVGFSCLSHFSAVGGFHLLAAHLMAARQANHPRPHSCAAYPCARSRYRTSE